VIIAPEVSGVAESESLPNGYLQTLDRGLQVLLEFTSDHRDFGVSEVARRFGWDKAVAQRVLATLTYRGFLAVDEQARRYRLGPALVALGNLAERTQALTRLGRPALARLMRACGESAVLSVADGADYRCAAAVDGRGPISYTAIVGSSLPAYGGAAGHALFAFQPMDEVDSLLGPGPYERYSEHTVVDLNELHARYREIRASGYAVSDGEYDPDAAAVAAPVRVHGVVVASLAAIGPRHRVMSAIETIIPLVVTEAARLGSTLSDPAVAGRIDDHRSA